MNSPYDVIKKRYVTEKSAMLGNLHKACGNRSIARCSTPKYVFIVDGNAKKPQIAAAVKAIYPSVTVVSVNTIHVKPKIKNKRGKMNPGQKSGFKKAVVTLAPGNSLD